MKQAGRVAANARWITAFVLMFVASSSVPVLADSAPEVPPPTTTLPPAGQGADLGQLPTNQDMIETLGRFESEEAERLEQLESPAATSERETSRQAYAGFSPAQAEQLLSTQFAGQLEVLEAEPARFLSDATLDHPLGAAGALVTSDGHKALLEGTEPIRATDAEGNLAKINLTLEKTANGYEPVNPLVDLTIPESAQEGIEVGEQGLQIEQAGAEEGSTARPFGEMNVFYPEVATDTDLLVAPIERGAEFFDQLRSEDSPETLRFHVQLPAGAELRPDANAAEVVSGNGSKLAEVPPPTATDAQGQEVPVSMQVDGDSLVLEINHREGDYAYPILVDPIVQEAYWHNWNNGENLQLLEDGAWHWNTSEGASSSWVYGSTWCIYTCWGSHRGLYMDTPNGNLPANRWGQWSYSAPNSETYLSEAWVSPFWRDVHVNCPNSKYGQPYDYVGMWNESSWNRILYNESTKNNNEGFSDLESWGRALIIGMGTSSGISIPCWRDIMAGGVAIWLEDWSRPTLTTSSSSQWMDTSPIRLNASAYDAGLGVQKFKAVATNSEGHSEEWWTNNSCTGLYEAPCPHTWNLGEGSQPQLSYSPAKLPEGIDTLSVTAYDALEKPSFTTNEMTVRVDHAPPTINLSGTVTEQAKLGTELPSYTFKAEALDGNPTSKENSQARSGVTRLEIEMDGKAVTEPFVPKCAGQPNCGAEKEVEVPASTLSVGSHTLKVKATDAYGHVGVKELAFTTGDKKAPVLTATGLPAEFHPPTYSSSFGTEGVGAGQFKHPAGVAVDAKGNLWTVDRTNKRVEEFNEKGEFVQTFGKEVNKTKVEAAGTEAEKNVCTAASGNVCQAGKSGSGNGQFSYPDSIAIDSKGNVWVLDGWNEQIQEFNEKGEFVQKIKGAFEEAEGIAVDTHGNIWIADTWYGRLQEFNEKGEFQKYVSKGGQPTGVAIGPGGNVWVAEWTNNRVEEFNEKGEFIQTFGKEVNKTKVEAAGTEAEKNVCTAASGNVCQAGKAGSANGQLSQPSAISLDSKGDVWVLENGNSRVQEFNERGEYLAQFGAKGTGNGQLTLSRGNGLTTDVRGDVWVTDTNNNRVEHWFAGPTYSSSFGTEGVGAGQLRHPAGVAVDSKGNLWTADRTNNRVEEFNEKGEFIQTFGKEVNKTKVEAAGTEAEKNVCTAASGNICQAGKAGAGNGQFSQPNSIAVDPKGNVWVLDSGKLQEFNEKGEFVKKISGTFEEAEGIAVDTHGNIWVADTWYGRLQEFNEKGEFQKYVSKGGQPTGVAIGPGGNVWVTEWTNNRVEEFNEKGEFIQTFGKEVNKTKVEAAGTEAEKNVCTAASGNICQAGKAGAGNGLFSQPSSLSLDSKGDVWVLENGNNRVQEFNEKGEYLAQFGAKGTGNGQLTLSRGNGLTTDIRGDIWVTDTNNNRIERWLNHATAVGRHLEPISAAATDTGFGVTSVALKLTDEAQKTEVIEQTTQTCPKGTCPLKATFSGLDLSERPLGFYTLTVEATDGAGNAAKTSTVFSLDPGPPKISLSGTLAEKDGQPLGAASGELAIKASESDFPSSGIQTINVERDHQRVASYPFNCSSDCQEVSASYRYSAQRDGAERSNQAAAKPSGAVVTSLGAVSCASTKDCDGVGYYKNGSGTILTLAEHWNGSTWSVKTTPNPGGATESRLEGVSCVSATNCNAVGYYKIGTEAFSTLIEHYNGTEWAIVSSPNPSGFVRNYLYGVSCDSSVDCWAVGKSAPKVSEEEAEVKEPAALVEHLDSSEKWSIYTVSKAPAQLTRISCISSSSCMAVAGQGLTVERWSGGSWSRQTAASPPGGSGGTLKSVSCATESTCAAVGSYSINGHTAPLAERWNGSSWSVQATADPVGVIEEVTSSSLEGVSCPSAEACTAVGSRSSASESLPLVEGWDGTDWALQPAAIPSGATSAALAGIACTGAFECTDVGIKSASEALISSEAPGRGDQSITVEAVDKSGNTESTSITADVGEEPGETPECNREPTSVAPVEAKTATEAATSIEKSVPQAIAASKPTVEKLGEEIDPSYSTPKPNLENEDSLVEGETAVAPAGGVVLKGVACISPTVTTNAATKADVVGGGDAAVFANTAPATSTAVRPTAVGTTIVQSLASANAPTSFSWNVSLNPGESLVELPSGAVAITRPMSEGGSDPVAEAAKPASAETPASLNDAAAQIGNSEYQILAAKAETDEEVVAVIAQPWLILAQGSIIPLKIEVQPDVEVPTEYTMTYEYPPFKLNFTPKSIVTEEIGGEGEASISIATYGYCEWREAGHTTRSPCGHFDSSAAATYAEYWGNPKHDRNGRFPDYGDSNCTNFISQIIGKGGMHFLRGGEDENAVESWWERATGLPEPFAFLTSTSWSKADILPRHLWQYELAVIDPSQQPSGWGQGDILAYNWFNDGKGHFNHLNFVVGTQQGGGSREPLIANESEPKSANYSHMPWYEVKKRIEGEQGNEWNRLALTVVHTIANYGEEGAKKHDPDNLYGPTGFFRE